MTMTLSQGTFPEGVIEVNQPISRIKDYPILYGISHEGTYVG